MSPLLLDTHSVIWLLQGSPRLSKDARGAIKETSLRGGRLAVSTITIVEMTYLVERNRVPGEVQSALETTPDIEIIPITLEVARLVRFIPREIVPDMPDRIIAATALHLACPLVTCDRRLRQANLQVIW